MKCFIEYVRNEQRFLYFYPFPLRVFSGTEWYFHMPGCVHRRRHAIRHMIQHTAHGTSYTVHRTPYIIHRTPCIIHRTPHTIQQTPHGSRWKKNEKMHMKTKKLVYVPLRDVSTRSTKHLGGGVHSIIPVRQYFQHKHLPRVPGPGSQQKNGSLLTVFG